jgi:hypothetical protein
VIFLCGAVFGSAFTRAYLHQKVWPASNTAQMGERTQLIGGLTALKAQLNLTPEQEKIVTKELDDYAKYYQNIEEEREDVAMHGLEKIRSVLNPEQTKRFNELLRRSGK